MMNKMIDTQKFLHGIIYSPIKREKEFRKF